MSSLTRSAVCAAFLAVSNTAAAGPPVLPRFEWLPVFGRLPEQACAEGPLRGYAPGTVIPQRQSASPYAEVLGPDCRKTHVFSLDTAGQPQHMVSRSRLYSTVPPQPPAGTVRLEAGWWQQPDILPLSPQGAVSVDPALVTGLCTVSVAGSGRIAVRPKSVVITDIKRAFYVAVSTPGSQQGDGSCTLSPLVTFPGADTAAISVSGGGIRNPGRISAAPGLEPTPASAAVPVVGMAMMATALTALGLQESMNSDAYKGSIGIILGYGADVANDIKTILGLSDTEIGRLATEAPGGRSYEDYLNRPISGKAEELSAQNREIEGRTQYPGSCNDDFKQLEKKQDNACGQGYSCSGGMAQSAIIANVKQAQQCLDARIQMMDQCFDGGDAAHRKETLSRTQALRKCQGLLQ